MAKGWTPSGPQSASFMDATTAGLTVVGGADVASNFRMWAGLSVYVQGITVRRVAERIIAHSNAIMPFDTGLAQDSHFIEDEHGAQKQLNKGSLPSTASVIDEALVNSGAINIGGMEMEGVPGTTMMRGGRTVTRYAIGYDVAKCDYVSVIHENPFGQVWRNNRRDHFLLEAYSYHNQDLKTAYFGALKVVEKVVGDRAAKQAKALLATASAPTNALSAGGGPPRLVRR
jgi:hypothetical protein